MRILNAAIKTVAELILRGQEAPLGVIEDEVGVPFLLAALFIPIY